MNKLQHVIIFGVTSSIAEHTARQLIAQGASIYCVGRNPLKLEAVLADLRVRAGDPERVQGIAVDLTDCSRHSAVIKSAEAFLGHVDAALVAHGSLSNQSECQNDIATMRAEFECNAFSVISLLALMANRFEEQGNGVIAVIGSVAGDRGRQSNYVYGAAKGMVAIFAQGLRNRLAKSQVDVVTVKPGFVDTPMTADFEKSGPLWAQPEQIARGIVNAMKKGKSDVYLPWFWWGVMTIIRNIPEAIFKRLSL